MTRSASNPTHVLLLLSLLAALTSGCASFGRGLGEALVGSETEDTRECHVRGPAFPGMESFMRVQEEAARSNEPNRALKLLMVHGIGSHQPGHGTRLAENLAAAMGLPIKKKGHREFQLEAAFETLFAPNVRKGEGLGTLRVSRFFNEGFERDMFFYELTWDPIVEEEKQTIAYDNSGEQSFRRANLNENMKAFVNDTVPDVMMYKGSSRGAIQTSVAQAVCWMLMKRWSEIPEEGSHACDPRFENMPLLELDEVVFVSHSLGSRIVLDSLATTFKILYDPDTGIQDEVKETFRRKRFPFFMLSNQLPLLQLGRKPPPISGQIPAYCEPGGSKLGDRWVKEVEVIAFSDPNDVMSYTLPPGWVERYADSRMCPTVVNVLLNVAKVNNLLGLGRMANPYEAHVGYDDDERVIGLMVGGIGFDTTESVVAERCTWVEERD